MRLLAAAPVAPRTDNRKVANPIALSDEGGTMKATARKAQSARRSASEARSVPCQRSALSEPGNAIALCKLECRLFERFEQRRRSVLDVGRDVFVGLADVFSVFWCEAGRGGDHGCRSFVDGVDDLGVVDAA